MTIRLILATLVGACGAYLIVALHTSLAEVVTGLGLVLAAFGLVVDHRY